jgi:hypothetical protein
MKHWPTKTSPPSPHRSSCTAAACQRECVCCSAEPQASTTQHCAGKRTEPNHLKHQLKKLSFACLRAHEPIFGFHELCSADCAPTYTPNSSGIRCRRHAGVRQFEAHTGTAVTCSPDDVGTRATNRPRRSDGCGAAGSMKFAKASPAVIICKKRVEQRRGEGCVGE